MLCERKCCLDPKLYGGAVPTVCVKVVSVTEVNCEKRSFEVLLCTQDVHQSERSARDALLSYQNTFGLLQCPKSEKGTSHMVRTGM